MINPKIIPLNITGDLNQINYSIDSFKDMREGNFLYIDKTKMIDDILTFDKSKVVLFTRPRRFGKSLNISMLRYFFDMAESSAELFKGLYIENSEFFKTHLNQYPVLYLNFKNVKTDILADLNQGIISCLQTESQKLYNTYHYEELMEISFKAESGGVNPLGAEEITRILCEKTGKKVIVLVDEYDSVINRAYGTDGWKQATEIIKGLFGALFKSNEYLEMGVLTGVSKIGKELGFSDMNNLAVYSLTRKRYYEYFGFTEDEVKELLNRYGIEITDEFYRMYNGYRFKGTPNMFNPASILKFLDEFQDTRDICPAPYWVNATVNHILTDNIAKQNAEFKDELLTMLSGETIIESVFDSIDYNMLHNPAHMFSLMIDTGYICPVQRIGGDKFELKIPNEEVLYGYKGMIGLIADTDEGMLKTLCTNLTSANAEKFEETLNKILLSVSSFHDFSEKENSYHNLVMGALLYLMGSFTIFSNREAGLGRYDIALFPIEHPKNEYRPIIIEFKAARGKAQCSYDDLAALATEALEQIKSKKYAQPNENAYSHAAAHESAYGKKHAHAYKPEDFMLIGIGAQGKQCAVVSNF
ncbi:MAG: ATP-binding protein [Clostridiales bacterium]|nr:ATP-binding protein [Clostridiales bacterium]